MSKRKFSFEGINQQTTGSFKRNKSTQHPSVPPSSRGGDNSEDADLDNIDYMENEEPEEDIEDGVNEDEDPFQDWGLPFDADCNSDEELYAEDKTVDAGILEYDEDVNPSGWEQRLESISGMSEQETSDYRGSLGIPESVFDVPRPVKSFQDCPFSPEIMSALKMQAYERPTAIQCKALPIVLSGRDVICIAKTGSGKTAAYVLPMIVHVMKQSALPDEKGPIGVICAPTNERVNQIYLEAKKFSFKLRVSAVYDELSIREESKEHKVGCHIVIATPGRLLDLLFGKALTMTRATYLVLDGAAQMFDLGLEQQVKTIAEQIHHRHQTLLFSATMPKEVDELARAILSDPVRVTVGEEGMANEDITQFVNVIPSDADKLPWLLENLPGMIDEGDVLVFASKQATVKKIKAELTKKSIPVAALGDDEVQASRMKTLQKFQSGICRVLIATDVAAQGLDIKSLKTVVSYDIAEDIDMHVHRISATGRAGDKDGVAYTLVTQREAIFAGKLVNSLLAAGQNVPPELTDLAMKERGFKPKFDWRKRDEPLTLKVKPSQTVIVHSYTPDREDEIRRFFEVYEHENEIVTKRFSIFTFSSKEDAAEALRNFDNGQIGQSCVCQYINNLDYSQSRMRPFICRESSSTKQSPVDVLLDLDTCPFPKKYSAETLSNNFRGALLKDDYIIRKIYMYGTLLKEDKWENLFKEFKSFDNVRIHRIRQKSKSAVDHGRKRKILPFDLLHLKMLSCMVKNGPPYPLLIISANDEVLELIKDLVKRNYQVLLAYEKKNASEGLKNTARSHLAWSWKRLYKGKRGKSYLPKLKATKLKMFFFFFILLRLLRFSLI